MKRLIRSVLALAIAITATLHTVAYARTPIEYYNDIAQIFDESIDISETIWHNKTKLAYLAFLNSRAGKVSSPTDLYRACLRLEEVTGYDIVYTTNGKYYIETSGYTDDAPGGGALYGVPIDLPNYTKAYAEFLRWLDLIVDHGPRWPYEGTNTQPDGPVEDGDYVIYPLIKNYYVSQSSSAKIYYDGKTYYLGLYGVSADRIMPKSATFQLRVPKTILQNISSNYPNWLITTNFYVSPESNGAAVSGRIYLTSTRNVDLQKQQKNGETYDHYYITAPKPFYRSQYIYMDYNYADGVGTLTMRNTTPQWELRNSADYDNDDSGLLWMPGYQGTSGPDVVPPATDNTPPEIGGDTHISIDWPDISIPSISLTTTSGPTTAGDIDFTPVTSRLDTINQNLNLFANSFNNYRSDWLEMWEAFEDAVDETGERLFNLESYLRSCRDWLVNIFNKPTGGSNVTMPDPMDFGDGSTGDEGGGFWDWLGRFLDRLIGDLPDDVSSFATALGALTGKFPFSVPWDVAFMLGLMSQEPETPQFDIVQPSISMQAGRIVYGEANTIHVDLSDYDEDARLFRACVVMAFCLCLATHTYETLRGMDWAIFE